MMTEKDSAHSITINIPRIRTFAKVSAHNTKKNTKKKVCEKVIGKSSDTTLRNYKLPSNKPIRINAMKNYTLPLPYKLYTKEQKSNLRSHHAAIKLQETYKITSADWKIRLQVENPPDDVRAKTDFDENYFRYLNSHPAFQYIPMYKSLRFQFHERLRTRQEIGYKEDCILNIEENSRREHETYIQSVNKYANQIKQLDEFIAEDYQKSMNTLKESDALVGKLNTQISLRQNLASEQFLIESRLIGLDHLYFVQQKYGRFLYYLSPPSWRSKYRDFARSVEIEAKGFDLGTSSEEDTFNVIFHNMEKECCNGLVKPVLYFTHPDDLMVMFESMEKQHLNNFIHVISLSHSASALTKHVQKLKISVLQDTTLVAHLIEGFERLVDFCEKREAQLQAKFIKILNGLFLDTVAAPDVLRLKLNLEFYYEKLYREESFNSTRSCLSTAKALENMYMDYSFKLDALSSDNLTMAIKKCIQREANKFKKAHIAARELRSFDRLEQSLLRAYEKSSPNVESNVRSTATYASKRNLTRKQKRQSVKPMDRISSQQYALTEAEIEYLLLFTDWNINDDPAKYLSSLSTTDRNNFGTG